MYTADWIAYWESIEKQIEKHLWIDFQNGVWELKTNHKITKKWSGLESPDSTDPIAF